MPTSSCSSTTTSCPILAYLAAIERHMATDPGIVVATGLVLADGIGGPGLTLEAAERSWRDHARSATNGVSLTFSGYGCNMALRLAPVRENGVRFDERLPLYGWQEDVDLSRRLAPFGYDRARSRPRAASIWASNPDAAPACGWATRRSPIRSISSPSGAAIRCGGRCPISCGTWR